ncbi:hypothetical protein [Pelagicoccus sp. SDUM812003]|uniref:hypothetical protein n=1 Tax=Pelagicoccus sp. SDUM812003 TaxID=3041267 RepID=UPI00280CAF77|nr:hypothetical protein [Pelagicoccus sp. SDUM812003]MDQ8201844.1 hypothetical protein [Pelagicoccus sp. SDUM812003]
MQNSVLGPFYSRTGYEEPRECFTLGSAGRRLGRGLAAASLALGALTSSAFALQAQLSWTDNSDNESGFNVERSVEGGDWSLIGTTEADVAVFVDSNVESGTSYAYRVNAYNEFGNSGFTNVATFYDNLAPTVSALSDITIEENETYGPISFTIGDVESEVGDLIVSIHSDNTTVVDSSGLVLEGTGSTRTLTITPLANQSGTAIITVSVDDGEDVSISQMSVLVNEYVAPAIDLAVSFVGNGARSGEAFEVSISSSDLSKFSSVSYTLDGEAVGSSSDAPFAISVTASEGARTLAAVAQAAGNDATSTDSQVINVGSAPTDSQLVDGMRDVSTDHSSPNGSVSYDLASDSFTVTDDLGVIGGISDSHRYYHALVSGDVDVRVRLASLDAASGETVAGIMLRSALYGRSVQSSLLVAADGSIEYRSRESRAGQTNAQTLDAAGSSYSYLRMKRVGSNVTLFGSADGSTWTELASDSVELGEPYFVGLALAGGSSSVSTAVFDKFEIIGAIQDWPADASAPAVPSSLIITNVN